MDDSWIPREPNDNSVDFGSFLLAERRAMEAEERAAVAEERLQETQDQMFFFNPQFSADPFSSSPSLDMLGLPPPPPSFALPEPPTFPSFLSPNHVAYLADIHLGEAQPHLQAPLTNAYEQQLIPAGTVTAQSFFLFLRWILCQRSPDASLCLILFPQMCHTFPHSQSLTLGSWRPW